MSNMAYLYSIKEIPSRGNLHPDCIGLSEWPYDVPLVYKILLSGEPMICPSYLFDIEDDIAVVGQYNKGVAKLEEFLNAMDIPEIKDFKDEALDFLMDENNTNNYFLLEAGEIFEMGECDFRDSVNRLFDDIKDIDLLIEKETERFQMLVQAYKKRFNIFKRKAEDKEIDIIREIERLGLGYWENALFYDLSFLED